MRRAVTPVALALALATALPATLAAQPDPVAAGAPSANEGAASAETTPAAVPAAAPAAVDGTPGAAGETTTTAVGVSTAEEADVPYVAPSMGAAAFRLFVGLLGVGVAMAASLAAYRWFLRRRPGGVRAGLERRLRPQVVSRTYLGAKESLCVVEVADERFLIATTPTRISLLGRLERAGASAPSDAEPRASDFARALRTAASAPTPTRPPAPPATDETEMLTALARSRDRLARLVGVATVQDRRA
jgi:flagellar biogenesis protein FliO